LKSIEGTDHFISGNMESLGGDFVFEGSRAAQTWATATNVPEAIGGAEEIRRNKETGELESRYLAVTG
jgi:hypothetical protein